MAVPLIWEAIGDVPNYVTPFFGSGADILQRPHPPGIETANDRDGFLCNAFRSLKHDPEQTAHWAKWPANECCLHARHVWLRERRDVLTRRLEGDPDYYDAKIAGWWLWGIALWIGGGWCNPDTVGPWVIIEDTEGYRQLVCIPPTDTPGVHRNRLHLGNAGQGVHRKLLHAEPTTLETYFAALSHRLERVRMCCGDWTRVLSDTVTWKHGLTGVLLDPPYAHAERTAGLYGIDEDVSAAVRDWAVANGDNHLLRIVLCGYEGEHAMPASWRMVTWQPRGGYGTHGTVRGRDNKFRERLWLSPHCLGDAAQRDLFAP